MQTVKCYLFVNVSNSEYDVVKDTSENQLNETLILDFVMQRLLNTQTFKFMRNPDNVRILVSNDNIVFREDKHGIICHKCKSKGHC